MISLIDIANLLVAAHAGGPKPTSMQWPLHTALDAYAVQDACMAELGPIGGWKVGAGSPEVEPHCAPLPTRCIVQSGGQIPAARHPSRWVELEVGLRVGVDLQVSRDVPTPAELAECFDAVVPTIEVVDSRLAEGRDASTFARLADLQSHGALVVGEPLALAPDAVDLRTVAALLWFGETNAARTIGGNPARDIWRLVGWLARHCTERGMPLRKGQIVTTGSCTGLLEAPAGQLVRGEIGGVSCIELRFNEVD